jgi:hypothetical protein
MVEAGNVAQRTDPESDLKLVTRRRSCTVEGNDTFLSRPHAQKDASLHLLIVTCYIHVVYTCFYMLYTCHIDYTCIHVFSLLYIDMLYTCFTHALYNYFYMLLAWYVHVFTCYAHGLRTLYTIHSTCHLHGMLMLFSHVVHMVYARYIQYILHVIYMVFSCYIHVVHMLCTYIYTCCIHVIYMLYIYMLYTCCIHVIYMFDHVVSVCSPCRVSLAPRGRGRRRPHEVPDFEASKYMVSNGKDPRSRHDHAMIPPSRHRLHWPPKRSQLVLKKIALPLGKTRLVDCDERVLRCP